MPSKNIKQVLVDAASLPASVEASLPDGVPKISSMLTNFAASMPTTPDLPLAIPDLPAMPAFAIPGVPGMQTKVQEAPPAPPAKKSLVSFVYE